MRGTFTTTEPRTGSPGGRTRRARSSPFGAGLLALLVTCAAVGYGAASPVIVPVPAARNDQEAREYEVKAMYLLNFLRYTTWPKECFEKAESPIVVGIVGTDPFDKTIDKAIEGRKIGKRGIVVRRYPRVKDLESDLGEVHMDFVGEVHMVFVGELQRGARRQLLDLLADEPVATVGDEAGLAKDGATLSFFLDGGNVKFEASTKAIKRSRIEISSQVLKLAKVVD